MGKRVAVLHRVVLFRAASFQGHWSKGLKGQVPISEVIQAERMAAADRKVPGMFQEQHKGQWNELGEKNTK